MIERMLSRTFAAALLLSSPSLARPPDLSGIPRIIDADTVEIDGTHVRLAGIDAPETAQVCLDASGSR